MLRSTRNFALAVGVLVGTSVGALTLMRHGPLRGPKRLGAADSPRPKKGDRFDYLQQTYEVIKVHRNGDVDMARSVADAFGKKAFIDHKTFHSRDFTGLYTLLKPLKGLGAAKHGQILDAATLTKKLKALRRDFKQMLGFTSSVDVDASFRKLKARGEALQDAAFGFFPEANELSDQALADLRVAREAAYVDAEANRDAAGKAARAAELEEKRDRNIEEWWRRK